MISAPAPAELTPPPTPKIAAALSPATCIPTEPQVQPHTPLTLCRNCQATFTSRNRLHKHLQHLRFDCFSTTIKNAVKSTTTSTSTTSSSPFLQSFDYVQQQITKHTPKERKHTYDKFNQHTTRVEYFTDDNKQRQVKQLFMEMEVGENEDSYDFDNG
jgi:hypothetical protein